MSDCNSCASNKPAPKTNTVEFKNLLPSAKNIIAVGSGKGGVGKSTVAANLAVAIAKLGYRVGLLDADIYGPSIHKIFGTSMEDIDVEDAKIIPIDKFGVKTLSIGNLIDPGKATIWRGPLIHTALTQMISDAAWGDLDYFVIDLPPGTGDVQISLAQLLKIKGFLAVSTPQDMSLVDVVKAIDMFEKVNVPLIGIVENMSYFVCDSCEKKHYIFGESKVKTYAGEVKAGMFYEIPIEKTIMESGESGEPYAVEDKDGVYEKLAAQVMKAVTNREKSVQS
jgi:ATP-binding protein involved in chromosome partitioning